MDAINKALMLEFSYRLTVAINLLSNKLVTFPWMKSWNSSSLACAEKWNQHILSSVKNNNDSDIMFINIVDEIVTDLARGYEGLSGCEPLQDPHPYKHILNQAHKLAHAPVFAEWGLSKFFILGQQLASNDLQAYFATINKVELKLIVKAYPPPVPLSEESFSCLHPNWPSDSAFSACLIQYINNRQRFDGSSNFSAGALVSLAQSIICPPEFPSTVWCRQDLEKDGPWHLYLAGYIFPAPTLVTVKDRNDKAFVALLAAMDKDKKAGCAVDDCGWVPRNELWPEMTNSNTRSKAWSKLTKETLAVLGEFESKGGVGKYKDTGGPCRVPATLARPDCRIFIEKIK